MSEHIAWQKSSFSGGGDGNECLELAARSQDLAFRESDDPALILTTNRDRLGALLSLIKANDPIGR
ncbi:DUF397 domain-containing protein [Streptomyces sp. 6N223]|uniref:DUF397 domain-containing protein n=1 Tax=Streptomyces sp. 6N223 TaxID=3457412 RepID=UPI003FCF9227